MGKVHSYNVRKGNETHIYEVSRLWQLAAELPVAEVAISKFDLKNVPWHNRKRPHLQSLIGHMQKILKADLSYPIILNSRGKIMDGYHRLARACLEKREYILAVQFSEDPPPDRITVSETRRDEQ